ncbi:MAG: YebC/PmpR family DNA-binding transcriptional regulator [Candidatus Babeliales bacterium]
MAGHSKWANIKHKKAREDAKRGKEFTKLSKEITVVARAGGGDPQGNARLRSLIDKAKSINMPLDNVHRAIKKGLGELPGTAYEEIMYEGYGPHGIALILEVLTDNKNRTVNELRKLFSSHQGQLAESGSVSWMFSHKGVITLPPHITTEEALFELLIDHGIEDIVKKHDNTLFIISEPKHLEDVKQELVKHHIPIQDLRVEWIPQSSHAVSQKNREQVEHFLEEVEDHDDVNVVYTNVTFE